RTCGRPRGENIAEGTRCAACGQRQALVLWLACGVSAGTTALTNGVDGPGAALVALVVLIVLPPALVLTILVHELTHALVAALLGQTVARVIVGEGRALVRHGRRPEFVFGTVLLGNGATSVLDLRRDGYRTRTCAMLLGAPAVSLGLAAVTWWASADWPRPAYAAGLTITLCNLALAVITLLPMPTFGGRVWSDLASALFVVRASEPQLEELIVHGARDAMAVDVERGDIEAAIDTARQALDVAPTSPFAHSLLAFALHRAGRPDEAAGVARAALAAEMDPADREYLQRFL
ncbi:MAG TPA: site-2 protease family protein, partial [Vicinamibacterales bacterium]|nr:site-2 protease family protein [Vicinamibacterales bacterium]